MLLSQGAFHRYSTYLFLLIKSTKITPLTSLIDQLLPKIGHFTALPVYNTLAASPCLKAQVT